MMMDSSSLSAIQRRPNRAILDPEVYDDQVDELAELRKAVDKAKKKRMADKIKGNKFLNAKEGKEKAEQI